MADNNKYKDYSDEVAGIAKRAYEDGLKELAIMLYTVSGTLQHSGLAMRELASMCVSFAEGMKRDLELTETAMRLFGADDYLDND